MSNKDIANNLSSRCEATKRNRHSPMLGMETLNMATCRINAPTTHSGNARPPIVSIAHASLTKLTKMVRDEDGRLEDPQYYEAPRRDERQHDSEHRDGYDSRDNPQPARASKPSDNSRRTESDSDGQAPTLPTGNGKHARNLRNDAQNKEW